MYTRLHSTQWRVSGTGKVIGLDYAPLAFCLELEGVPRADWPEVVTGIQTMEAEAMRLIRQKANR